MNADRIEYYTNLMRGVEEKDIERKIREILIAATNECEKNKKGVFVGRLVALPIYTAHDVEWDAEVRLDIWFNFVPSMQDAEVYILNPNAIGQEPCAAVCARSPAPTGCASNGDTEEE